MVVNEYKAFCNPKYDVTIVYILLHDKIMLFITLNLTIHNKTFFLSFDLIF